MIKFVPLLEHLKFKKIAPMAKVMIKNRLIFTFFSFCRAEALLYFTSSNSPGRQVLSNHGSSGP